ncbi:hypothetical protein NPIL_648041 [Nephila pilipes]|uniref:Uncharacterized protein n=1 Tax=Nephila pilipes TaxID=299642 RepID=A0A8X6R5F9_NEPPI|nr:hypothetical protein NPIL_648041 [Nephila pilipes]
MRDNNAFDKSDGSIMEKRMNKRNGNNSVRYLKFPGFVTLTLLANGVTPGLSHALHNFEKKETDTVITFAAAGQFCREEEKEGKKEKQLNSNRHTTQLQQSGLERMVGQICLTSKGYLKGCLDNMPLVWGVFEAARNGAG